MNLKILYAEQKKQGLKEDILYDSFHRRFQHKQNSLTILGNRAIVTKRRRRKNWLPAVQCGEVPGVMERLWTLIGVLLTRLYELYIYSLYFIICKLFLNKVN